MMRWLQLSPKPQNDNPHCGRKEAAMANKVSDARYREAAHRLHHDEGSCEVDENAKISRGDDPGAYVQAWVWVPNEDTKRKLTPEEVARWQGPAPQKPQTTKSLEKTPKRLARDICKILGARPTNKQHEQVEAAIRAELAPAIPTEPVNKTPARESRDVNLKDAVTLVQHIRDYANGITEERLTELWSEHTDAEVAEVSDKLAFVVDWIGLS
jgi:hypothetical protein